MLTSYEITGPTLVSFSGGRTSAFMLHQILQAHGGELPPETVVTFANTGKEREETLRFVQDCADQWAVPVVWLEYQVEAPGFRVVTFETASRNGEPFAELIRRKSYTPNSVTRFCTSELKIRAMKFYCQRHLGWKRWINAVGLRHDEGHRCLKAYARNEANKEPFKAWLPLDKAKVSRQDVRAFWAGRNFDLGLRGYEGNCDLCFLKGRNKLKAIIREQGPQVADWWSDMERQAGGQFVTEWSYADLAREVSEQPSFFDPADDDEFDAECGLVCGVDEVAA
jgi:3'-phosphoadenosine 5'-phosphosulfate sulfotransferase (PAPS reductase)/FAD synthetase